MSIDKMKVHFYGGVGKVTGANFLLQIPKFGELNENGGQGDVGEYTRILIDCGLVQGDKNSEEENWKDFPYDPASIDYLFITHAHLDHVGRIPKLVKDGFKGKIFSTSETKELARCILDDAVNILRHEAQERGRDLLYENADIDNAMSIWNTVNYHNHTDMGNFSVYLKDAGHILGSSMIMFTSGKGDNERTVTFTGDLGNSPSTLLKDTEDVSGSNYLIMESVYGDRNHEPQEYRKRRLLEVIKDSISRGGTLLIPTFSMERTQVLLSEINDFVENGDIKPIPVFVDSPLAIKITDIYRRYTEDFNQTTLDKIKSGDDVFSFPKLEFTGAVRDSEEIERTLPPKIIIAGSGMSMGGRIIKHESSLLPDPKNTILFVGYQIIGSTGRNISEGLHRVRINGKDVKVNAKVESISGYSAHKDSDHLLAFVDVSKEKLKKVFVVMGEPKSSLFLAQKINDNVGVRAEYPKYAEEYILE